MVLADGSTYANSKAVEALGKVHSPDVRSYLLEKLTTAPQHDISLIRATIHAVASALGVEAVEPLTAYLSANRRRDDGFRVLLSTTCVEALGEVGTSAIIAPLEDELRYMEQTELNLEYGSNIVTALQKTGDRSVIPILRQYERVVLDEMPDDEHQRSYYAMKIEEVGMTIEGLSTK